MKADDANDLIKQVVAHRLYKNLSPQGPDEVWLDIQRQICVRLTRDDCQSEGTADKWKPQGNDRIRITMGDVLAFSKASLEWVKSGFALTTPEESERRAAICRVCPLNVPMTGCSCDTFYKVLAASVPQSRKLPGLHVCGACHCSMEVKVLLTDQQVIDSNAGRDIVFPDAASCWQQDLMEKAAAQEKVAK